MYIPNNRPHGLGDQSQQQSQQQSVDNRVATQVSPQISPIFQQQFQPSNSALTASTSQTLPGMPTTDGGYNNGFPVAANTPTNNALTSAKPDYVKYALWGLGLVAVFAAYKMYRRNQAN